MLQCFTCDSHVAAHHLVGVDGLLVCPLCADRATRAEASVAPFLVLSQAIQNAGMVLEVAA